MKILPHGLRGLLHPNGFTIRLLLMWRNGVRLRLHTWSGDPRLESPHTHRSWFISIPLWGRFIERRFEAVEGSTYEVHHCHATTSGNGRPLTTFAELGSVAEVLKKSRWPLLPYFCPTDAIHSLVPVRPGFAVSVVFFGPNLRTPFVWLSKERA